MPHDPLHRPSEGSSPHRPPPDRGALRAPTPSRPARPPAHGSPAGPERGSVTAEAAVLLPVLFLVLGLVVGVLACVAAQLRCVDAARAAARVAARGEPAAVVQQTGARLAPADAEVSVQRDGDAVEVVVSARVRPFGALRLLPAVAVSGRAVAAAEPGLP